MFGKRWIENLINVGIVHNVVEVSMEMRATLYG